MSAAEILNDADGELINFYYILHKHGRRLAAEVDSMPYSRALFKKMLVAKPRGAYRRAVRFWYLNRVAFGAKRRGASFGVAASCRRYVLPGGVLVDLDATVERLRGVVFESVDLCRLIRLYDRASSLFYIDPPFYGVSQEYACRFAADDHQRLAVALASVSGRWLLSYNDCSHIRRLYRGSRFKRLRTRYTIGANSRSCQASSAADELLISNRPLRRTRCK